jgi:acyl carrier protein
MNNETAIERFIIDELLLGDDRTTLDPDESLISSGVLDSLALLRLIAFLEDQMGVVAEDAEVVPENFETVNQIKLFIERKKAVG